MICCKHAIYWQKCIIVSMLYISEDILWAVTIDLHAKFWASSSKMALLLYYVWSGTFCAGGGVVAWGRGRWRSKMSSSDYIVQTLELKLKVSEFGQKFKTTYLWWGEIWIRNFLLSQKCIWNFVLAKKNVDFITFSKMFEFTFWIGP